MSETVVIDTLKTSWGMFGVALSSQGIGCLTFPSESLERCAAWTKRWLPEARIKTNKKALRPIAAELNAYFKGKLKTFTLPLDLRGTPFQLQVWRALLNVEYGSVSTYTTIAAKIKRPQAMRAVGAANGANPIPIIVPCHRIIGRNGKLVGYGGGLDMKYRLLKLEGVLL
jgi:methylated-DNA-[protein]-cysteine S-methyltransferase